jgi:hypothetical protein
VHTYIYVFPVQLIATVKYLTCDVSSEEEEEEINRSSGTLMGLKQIEEEKIPRAHGVHTATAITRPSAAAAKTTTTRSN